MRLNSFLQNSTYFNNEEKNNNFKPHEPYKNKKKEKMAKEQPLDSGTDVFNDINVKLRDIEEKQSIIKDRVLLIGDNLVSQKSESEEELLRIKTKIFDLEDEIKRLKLIVSSIIESTNNFARKTELDIIKRQFEMFQPMELARLSDVKNLIERAIKNQK